MSSHFVTLEFMNQEHTLKIWLSDHLNELSNISITILGDVMLDEYHWCTVNRISPEAPVQVCKVDRTTLVPGGAANVAFNILSLNSKPTLIGVIGTDSTGEKLTENLSDNNISTHGILTSTEKPTILKSRIIAHHQHVVRVDREDPTPLSQETTQKLFSKFSDSLENTKAIILSDYAKGTLSDSFLEQLIQHSKSHALPVIIDPKGDDYNRYKGASILTPNFGEFLAAINQPSLSEEDILPQGLHLINKLELDALVITRSEKGITIVTQNAEKIDIPTKARDVYDITGAGDTVLSTLTLGIAANWPLEKAVYAANYAAGNVVAKIGTATTTIDAIKEAVENDSND